MHVKKMIELTSLGTGSRLKWEMYKGGEKWWIAGFYCVGVGPTRTAAVLNYLYKVWFVSRKYGKPIW